MRGKTMKDYDQELRTAVETAGRGEHGFDVDQAPIHKQAAEAVLRNLRIPAGRAGFTNAQQIELAQAHATLALVEAVEVQNAIAALQLGIPTLEHDETASVDPKTISRITRRNRLRRIIRDGLGL